MGDFIEGGLTLDFLMSHIHANNPVSIEISPHLDERPRRICNLTVKYVGFEMPGEFLVGYGLDYQEKFRNLPFIGAFGEKQQRVR